MVERAPEKGEVVGSLPTLGTIDRLEVRRLYFEPIFSERFRMPYCWHRPVRSCCHAAKARLTLQQMWFCQSRSKERRVAM